MNDTKNTLVNRVATSKLKIINLEHFYPSIDIVEFDVRNFLYMDLILKEKEYRAALKEADWSVYQDKAVALHCSSDAIIPTWAFMLVASYLAPVASRVFMGNKEELIEEEFRHRIEQLDYSQYQDELIVIKGCSTKKVPESAYVHLTVRLQTVARSIMFGEACSTVPIYKKPKNPKS